jgi:hypothetical protein
VTSNFDGVMLDLCQGNISFYGHPWHFGIVGIAAFGIGSDQGKRLYSEVKSFKMRQFLALE